MIIKPKDIILRDGLALLEPVETETEGYMNITNSEDKPYVVRIVNLGNGSSYKEGDVVLVGMHATTTMSFNGRMYYLIDTKEILGIIKDTQ